MSDIVHPIFSGLNTVALLQDNKADSWSNSLGQGFITPAVWALQKQSTDKTKSHGTTMVLIWIQFKWSYFLTVAANSKLTGVKQMVLCCLIDRLEDEIKPKDIW